VEVSAPSRKKTEAARGVRAMNVGAWTILRTFALNGRRKLMVIDWTNWQSSRITVKMKPSEGRQNQSQTLQAQPSEKKEWLHNSKLCRTNGLKEGAM
jgi:hypothetical protein